MTVVIALVFTMGFRRDHQRLTRLLQRFEHPRIGVITFIGQHSISGDGRKKYIGAIQIAGLAAGQMKAGRIAQCIDRGMDFRTQATFTASDGLVPAFFFSAPALC